MSTRTTTFAAILLLASGPAFAQNPLTETRPTEPAAKAVKAAPDAPEVQDLNAIIHSLAPIRRPGQEVRQAIDLDIRFRVGSSELSPDAAMQLGELGQALISEALASSRIEIAGHTDASGAAEMNKELSLKRAESVKSYLAENFGIDPERLATVGWGEEKLKDAEHPNSGVNRRVEIVNLTIPESSPAAKGTKRSDGIKFR